MKKLLLSKSLISLIFLTSLFWSCQSDLLDGNIPEEQGSSITPKNVTVAQARQTAVHFLQQTSPGNTKSIPTLTDDTIDEVQTIENEDGIPIMYALNLKDEAGFVVMSASFVERPILAYSHEGRFDFADLHEYGGVADWAVTRYLKINALIEAGNKPSEHITNQWAAVNPAFGLGFGDENGNVTPWIPPVIVEQWDEEVTHHPVLTTRWNQRLTGDPTSSVIGYNTFVRFNNCTSGTAPTGCVATAMGQIMKYHNAPNIYNIHTMPSIVHSGNYTSPAAHNIGYLMQDIGIRVAMGYSCSESGAHSLNARNAFVNHYNYSASGLTPLSFNPLVASITSNKPVYLDGCRVREIKTRPVRLGIFRWSIGSTTYSYDECHAWVADGLQEIIRTTVYDNGVTIASPIAEHIHMNWGWGNRLIGWYHYESWDQVNGFDHPTVDFIYNQNMIYNITPN